MKKQLLLLAIAFMAMLTFNPCTLQAQDNPPHVYHMITWYNVPGMDSAMRADRNAVMKEYMDKVIMKNELVLHCTTLNHFFTEDSREFVMLMEFAKWDDIAKSFDRDSELENQAWPDKQKRDAFMKKMNSFFTHHKDAIYGGAPGLSK